MKKKILFILILLLIALLGFGGYYYYKVIYSDPDAMNERQLQENNEAYDYLYSTLDNDTSEYEYTVLINPIAGGGNNGLTNGSIHESDIVLAVSNYVKELNEDTSLRIVSTRIRDVNPTPEQRQAIYDLVKPDMIIELHVSSDSLSNTMGTVVYYDDSYYNYSCTNDMIADTLEKAVVSRIEGLAAGIYPSEDEAYSFAFNHRIPSAVLSCGYITNSEEGPALMSDEYRKNIARGILDAIEQIRANEEE